MKSSRNLLRLAVLGFALGTATFADAQVPNFPQTLPANSVVGRLGQGAGPAEAIPFSQLGPNLITNFLSATAPLSVTGLALKITGTAGAVLAGSGATFTATPTLGVASTTTGTLSLANSGNTGIVTLAPASSATTWTFKFPTTAGSNGQSLITDGSGNTSWAAGAGTVNSGTAGQLGYYATTAAAISGNANLTVSAGALTVGVAGAQQGTVLLAGSGSGSTTLAGQTSGGGTMTFPAGSDTVMTLAATQTATNKTFTSPTLNSPTMTTPTLGVASATSINKVAITAPATSATLTIADGKTLTDTSGVGASILLGATGGGFSAYAGGSCTNQFIRSLSAAAALTCATVANADLANSSLTIGSTSVSLGGTAATVAGLTLTAPTINAGTATALTGLGIRSSGSGAFDLTLANTENLTAGRTFTLTLNNASRLLSLSGDFTTAAAFTTAGANALTLTTTGTTNVTLPTSGTLAVQNASNTFSATNTFSAANTFSALTQLTDAKFSSGKLYPTSDSTTALQITKSDGATAFVTFDSTNKRVGINKTPGAFDLDVNGALNVGTTITFTTLDATSFASSTSTITGLTANNSPVAANDYVPYFSAADGKVRKITLAALVSGSVAGVANLNGLTGGLSVATSGQANVAASGTTVTVAVPDHFDIQNCTLAASVGSSILTVAVKDNAGADPSATSPCRIAFRSATAATGSSTIDSVTGALSMTTNATGATLGSTNSTAFRFWVVAFDNAGTVVLSLYNASTANSCQGINEGVVQSSTAVSGSATSAGVYYTPNGTTLSSKAIKILGYVEYNSTGLATAGTYASGPNFIQTFGPGIARPCTPIQVQQVSNGSQTNSTSSSYVVTGVAATITPTSAANPIRFDVTGPATFQASAAFVKVRTYWAAGGSAACTNAIGPTQLGFSNTGGAGITAVGISFQHIPNTASSLTYTACLANNDNSTSVGFPYISGTGTSGNIIVTEIQG